MKECITPSFSPADLDEMEFPEDAMERKAIRIMNPINEDLSLMRTTLAPQMIHAMGRNQKRAFLRTYFRDRKCIYSKVSSINRVSK